MITNPIDFQEYKSIPAYNGGGDFVTAEILKEIFPNLSLQYAEMLSVALNDRCKKYGLNKPEIFHEFVATCGEESANFTVFTENLNYSAQGLANTWPTRYAVDSKAKDKVPNALAKKLARKPQAIANNAYANRNGNGDEASGDGWRLRGGGAIQLTGKDMYAKYAKFISKTIEQVADLVRNDLKYSIDSACWVFAVEKKLIDEAEADDFKGITIKINGGLTNFENRNAILARAKKALPLKVV